MFGVKFTEVQRALQSENDILTFRCIAIEHDSSCNRDLDDHQKNAARESLRMPSQELRSKHIKDIICCLLCAEHQEDGDFKSKIRKQWVEEPGLCHISAKDRAGSASPYPLSCKRGDDMQFSASSALSVSPASRDTPLSRRASAVGQHRASVQSSGSYRQSLSVSSLHRCTPSTSADSLFNESNEDGMDQDNSESPSYARQKRSGRQTRSTASVDSAVIATASAPAKGSPSGSSQRGRVASDRCIPKHKTAEGPTAHIKQQYYAEGIALSWEGLDEDDDAQEEGAKSHGPREEFDTPEAMPVREDRFTPGKAASWSPRAVRSDVIGLLFRPLPVQTGAVYAVAINSKEAAPMVKIGKTEGDVWARMKQIQSTQNSLANPHDRDFVSQIPVIYLPRVEALVHADLAFFQCYLHERESPSKRAKNFREYFRVDVSTAKRSIDLWTKVVLDLNLHSGEALDNKRRREFQQSLDRAVKSFENGNDGADKWIQQNWDHDLRQNIWSATFRTDA